MQNRILSVIVVILSIIYCSIDSSINTTFFNSTPNTINVNNEEMNLEEYVIGVVASEMPASFNIEALKAQAVAARTYAMYKKSNNKSLVTDVSNQGYITIDEMKLKWKSDFDKYYQKIKDAVMDTKGKILYYDNKIVEAYYFSMSNGYTEKASLVFSSDRDYLQSVESVYETKLKNFVSTKTFSKEEVCSKLDINCDEFIVTNIIRSNSGRVTSIKINGEYFKGTTIRKKLGLRSTDFSISLKDNNIIITTKGYGHGVGMSQYGANGMANDGKTYDEILKYYYNGVEIDLI